MELCGAAPESAPQGGFVTWFLATFFPVVALLVYGQQRKFGPHEVNC
jgi:hypothetical protein